MPTLSTTSPSLVVEDPSRPMRNSTSFSDLHSTHPIHSTNQQPQRQILRMVGLLSKTPSQIRIVPAISLRNNGLTIKLL
ncbi:hypothetical protein BDQ17DRAFT_1364629, partial [Cyathus striatus]